MPSNRGYALGPGWKGILAQLGVDAGDILRRAQLPEDLLNRDDIRISTEELFHFHEALDASVPDPGFWVQLTKAVSPEWFTPPIFAALCSPNLATAAERLALFKPLIGPISLDVRDARRGLDLTYQWKNPSLTPPRCLHAAEALFIVKLARLGTRQRICPTAVHVPELPRAVHLYEDYLGVRLRRGTPIRISFS